MVGGGCLLGLCGWFVADNLPNLLGNHNWLHTSRLPDLNFLIWEKRFFQWAWALSMLRNYFRCKIERDTKSKTSLNCSWTYNPDHYYLPIDLVLQSQFQRHLSSRVFALLLVHRQRRIYFLYERSIQNRQRLVGFAAPTYGSVLKWGRLDLLHVSIAADVRYGQQRA